MKKLGILGGTSFPSTAMYYTKLNEMYNNRLGGFHSCPIALHSMDYEEIKSIYYTEWDAVPALLEKELNVLFSYRPDCFLIANNTLHKAYQAIQGTLNVNIPMFNILELTANYISEHQFKSVLLLGTKFTMTDNYFSKVLEGAGAEVVLPNWEEIEKIQQIQTEVSLGKRNNNHTTYFKKLADRYRHLDGIVLACTEIPLIFEHVQTDIHLIDTMDIQCNAAVEFLVSGNSFKKKG